MNATFKGALEGVRVVDFGHVWAAPYCSATLADLGAEVIKVESSKRLDVHRRQGPYPDGVPGHDRSGVWNAQNRGKRSLTLNLAHARGSELARDLVAVSDIVVENFTPGVMGRLGLGYDDLATVRPDLVMVSMSAFGQCGPQRSYVGYGPSLDAWAGLDSLTRYPGDRPQALGGVFPDTGSALYAATAIIGALLSREATGEGAYIDLSELEVSSLLVGETVFDALSADVAPNSAVDSSKDVALLCSDGVWAMVTVNPSQVAELCEVGDAFGDVRSWGAGRTREEVLSRARALGVAAGPVQDVVEVLEDPQLAARGFFRCLPHPHTGALPVYGPIWRMSATPAEVCRPAPLLGEANSYVLRQILGLSAGDVDSLIEAGVVV